VKYKLGLKEVQEQPQVMLASYFTSDLPSVESLKFPLGHADKIQPEMFLNNKLGDCAIAGSIEEVRLANALRGVTVNFTDATALANYSAITGYNPDDPSTDGGTDVHQLYDYRKTTGIVDADGQYHKIVAYAGLTPGDWDELLIALSMFDMVGIGIQVQDYCEQQFEDGQPWSLERGFHQTVGGHYIPVVGATDINTAQLYTWGSIGGITKPFYEKFSTVSVVALTDEIFEQGKTPEGLDAAQLAQDLTEFNGNVMSRDDAA
jgi:hypothetical protein